MSREDWDGIREHARRQHQERVAKTPQRLEYAVELLKANGIPFKVCNDITGQINAYFTNGKILTFYAGTGKIKGYTTLRGIKSFVWLCVNENLNSQKLIEEQQKGSR